MLIVRFTKHFKARRSEWLLAAVLTAIGFSYLTTPGLFDRSPLFDTMKVIMPQPRWGEAFAGIGVMRLVMLWINGSWSISPYFRTVGAFVSGILWLVLLLSQSFADTPPQTRWVWLVFLIFDMVNASDAARDAGASKANSKLRGVDNA